MTIPEIDCDECSRIIYDLMHGKAVGTITCVDCGAKCYIASVKREPGLRRSGNE